MRRKHRDLLAWQHAIALVKAVYQLTTGFPDSEKFGLTAQMRRAAISIPSNIAEGAARNTTKEFLHFLGIARGSLSELDTQIVIARELALSAQTDELETSISDLFGLLNGLINSLKRVETQ
ncbi:four helix bundle protein [Viridibacterium curvum]|uniref:Four helix bundle protein n=1 Tax=Viridibacterium curvum TaxID=1101404 RepID=A0ABP9QKG4_9RHOO